MSQNKVIQHVSDTAYWIAAYRAEESERPNALFKDPFAKKLAQEKGASIAKRMGNAERIRWTVTIRTRLIDELIARAISQGVDTILNLGSGLDSRPYRLDLPHSLHWIEADFPQIIDYKTDVLKNDTPHCHLSRVALDLTNDSLREQLLKDVSAKGRSVLILTEGVMPYLTVENGGALAESLARQPNFHFWIQDYLSPLFEKMYKAGRLKLQNNEPFLFFPENWEAFFKDRGWELLEMRYMYPEGFRLGRPAPTPWYFKWVRPLIPKAKLEAVARFSGFALLRSRR